MEIQNNKLVWCLSYFMVFLFSGCASIFSIKELPDQSFKSSDEVSLVFGRIEILTDGQHVELVPKALKHIYAGFYIEGEGKRYTFINSVNNGYFAVALPLGKYQINGGWANTQKGRVCWGHRKQSGSEIAPIIFDVYPSNATYIGNIRVFASMKERSKNTMADGNISAPPMSSNVGVQAADAGVELIKATGNLIGSMQSSQYLGFDSWEIKNEYEEAKKAFAILYPNHALPIEKLAEIKLYNEYNDKK